MPLTDTQHEITKVVVDRFLDLKQPTPRRGLVVTFKEPEVLDWLISKNILYSPDNGQVFLPLSLAFHYHGDPDTLLRAKKSVEVVLYVLQNMFASEPEKSTFTVSDVITHARAMYGMDDMVEIIKRGLYLVREFGVLSGIPSDLQFDENRVVTISERIVTLKNIDKAWDDHIQRHAAYVENDGQFRESGISLDSIFPDGGIISGVFQQPGYLVAGSDDYRFARMAVEEARKSAAEQDGRIHPKVGAVIVKNGQVISAAHRGEFEGNHAEYIALEKHLPDSAVAGATVYTTLEPCTTRNHPKIPCAQRLIDRKVARVVIGMLDPDPRITGKGQRKLRTANIITDFFPHDLMTEVEELNREFVRAHETGELQTTEKTKTNESIVFTLIRDVRRALARVSNLSNKPIYIENVIFEVLDHGKEAVLIQRPLIGGASSEWEMPGELVRQIVLTNDVGLSITYRTGDGKTTKTPIKIFHVVGSDGLIAKIEEGGGYLSYARCPVCNHDIAFDTKGINTGEELETKKRALEHDLEESCPNHKSSRSKILF